jgi:hypothetical protein
MAAVYEQDREMSAGSGGMPASVDYGPRSGDPTPEATAPASDQGSSAPPQEASPTPAPSTADAGPQPAATETPPASDDAAGGSGTAAAGAAPSAGAEGSNAEPAPAADASAADTGGTPHTGLDTADATISDLTGGTGGLGDVTDGLTGLSPASGLASDLTGIVDGTGLDTTGLGTGMLSGLVNEVASVPDTLLSSGGVIGGAVDGVTGLVDTTLGSTLDSALGLDTPLGTASLLSPVSNLLGDVDSSVQHLPLLAVDGGDLGSASAGNPNDTGVAGLLDSSLGTDSVLSPVSNLVGDASSGLHDLPLANLNGGDIGTAIVGDLNGSSSGNLVDLGAGQSADGIGVGVLSTPASDGHLLDANALAVGSHGPELVNADLAPALNTDAATSLLNGGDLTDLGSASSPLLAIHGAASDASVGDLDSSSSGHLIDVSAGPSDANGLGVDVLATPSDPGHTVDIGAVDTGANGPQLADASLLHDTGLLSDTGVPALNGIDVPSLGSASDLLNTDSSLATLNGGNNAADGGVAGGSIGNLVGSSTGHLLDADIGPTQSGDSLNILAAPTPADHTVSANAVDVGSDGPQLGDLGVLTGDAAPISIPAAGTGVDSLAGNVLSTTEAAASPAEAAPVHAVTETADVQSIVPAAVTGDHGVLDVLGHQVI